MLACLLRLVLRLEDDADNGVRLNGPLLAFEHGVELFQRFVEPPLRKVQAA